MKNVLLLGATGTAGSALTKKLLANTDCHLTLFARHAGKMYAYTGRITVVNDDAECIEELKAAMTETDVKCLIFMGAVGI